MKNKFYLLVLIVAVTLLHMSCEFESPVTEVNDVTLSGQIIESRTDDPIANVSIRITDGIRQVDATSGPDGAYSTTFTLNKDKDLTITIFKDGYITETIKQYVRIGTTVTIPLTRLVKVNVDITGKVIDYNMESGVENALISVSDGIIQASTVTGSDGLFSLGFYMVEDKELTIITSKDGFSADTLILPATVGDSIRVPVVTLINNVTISGEILESITSIPLFNALVRVTDGMNDVSTRTSENGSFTIKFPMKSNKEILLITSKEAYSTDSLKLFAEIGKSYLNITREIKQGQGGGNSTGGPASIYLLYQSVNNIGVRESGSDETAQIVFQVLDSTGVPINADNSVVLNFNFGGHPGGGEYLYPSSVITNELGRALVTMNSGTKAGVAQIIAEMVVNGTVIKSRPVLISIHGGFPDQNHFDISSDKFNYPAYGVLSYPIDFHILVGDKYSNPVRPGTAVHFETTSGVIQGSSLTDSTGQDSVTLWTQPYPNLNEPGYGVGFFRVTASTIDENNNTIQTSTVVLLSYNNPTISVIPNTFDIPNGGSQVFLYTITDQNGNPLTEGTTISVSVPEEDHLALTGATNLILPDESGINFSFTASDSRPDSTGLHQAQITILTSGPNGNKSLTISGTAK